MDTSLRDTTIRLPSHFVPRLESAGSEFHTPCSSKAPLEAVTSTSHGTPSSPHASANTSREEGA